MKEWRERALVEFYDELLRREVLAGVVPPLRLRARIEEEVQMAGAVIPARHQQVVWAAHATQ